MRERIEIEPVLDGFDKIDGISIEDVLTILDSKRIHKILCYPHKRWGEFRRHLIILTRSDYEMLAEDGCFGEITTDGPSLPSVGLHLTAKYKAKDFDVLLRHGITEAYPTEKIQLRKCSPVVSPEDGDFLEMYGISLTESVRPYRE